MRYRIGPVSGLLALASASAWTGCGAAPPTTPSRIVLIVVDTLRRDHVSAYGSRAATPNIDGLAERGQLFTNALSSFHQTTMSMASLFTGLTPSLETGARDRPLAVWGGRTSCGLTRFADPRGGDSCVPRGVTTLAEELRSAGYWTLGVVSNRLLFKPYGYEQGFDEWVEVGAAQWRKARTRELAERRAAKHVNRSAIEKLRGRPSDRFFLYLHYVDVHDWGLPVKTYAEAVTEFDRSLGEILGFLDSEALLNDAFVVLTSDHGEALGEKHALPSMARHKGNPSFEPLLLVPLIVAPRSPRTRPA